MSSLIQVKGIILTHMTASPVLKEAVMKVINCIDVDLDAIDYDNSEFKSDLTIKALDELDDVLAEKVEFTKPTQEEDVDSPVLRSTVSGIEEDEDDFTSGGTA